MKEWKKAEEEKRLMELEIMYLKSNQDPKLYDLILEPDEEAENLSGKENQTKKKKQPLISKQTPLEHFKLPHCMDMVPMSFPDTMAVQPLYNKLK